MIAAGGQEGGNGEKDQVEVATIFCLEHAAYAVVSEKRFQGLGVDGTGEVSVKPGGEGVLSNDSKDSTGVLENGDADGKTKTLGLRGAGKGVERL